MNHSSSLSKEIKSSSSELSASSEVSTNLRLLLGPGSEVSRPAASAGPAGPPDLVPVSSRYWARPDEVTCLQSIWVSCMNTLFAWIDVQTTRWKVSREDGPPAARSGTLSPVLRLAPDSGWESLRFRSRTFLVTLACSATGGVSHSFCKGIQQRFLLPLG